MMTDYISVQDSRFSASTPYVTDWPRRCLWLSGPRRVRRESMRDPTLTPDATELNRPCPWLSRLRRARPGSVVDPRFPTPTPYAFVSTRPRPGLLDRYCPR